MFTLKPLQIFHEGDRGGGFIFRSSHSPVTDLMHIFIPVHTRTYLYIENTHILHKIGWSFHTLSLLFLFRYQRNTRNLECLQMRKQNFVMDQ
jgi:hypothetical protein